MRNQWFARGYGYVKQSSPWIVEMYRLSLSFSSCLLVLLKLFRGSVLL